MRLITRDITRELDLDVLLERIVEHAARLLQSDGIVLRLWDEEQQLLVGAGDPGTISPRLLRPWSSASGIGGRGGAGASRCDPPQLRPV